MLDRPVQVQDHQSEQQANKRLIIQHVSVGMGHRDNKELQQQQRLPSQSRIETLRYQTIIADNSRHVLLHNSTSNACLSPAIDIGGEDEICLFYSVLLLGKY